MVRISSNICKHLQYLSCLYSSILRFQYGYRQFIMPCNRIFRALHGNNFPVLDILKLLIGEFDRWSTVEHIFEWHYIRPLKLFDFHSVFKRPIPYLRPGKRRKITTNTKHLSKIISQRTDVCTTTASNSYRSLRIRIRKYFYFRDYR